MFGFWKHKVMELVMKELWGNKSNSGEENQSFMNSSISGTNVSPHYRRDIDGLRALAIVPVVLFHAWPKYIKGGFIGVDIFFVISGYLISKIIFQQHTKGSFDYKEFCIRRIRRIFPSLLLVMATTLSFGFFNLWKDELVALCRTLIAGAAFSANLQVFFLSGGYFDPDVNLNPLLHLWSLGVEEQFYIIWPWIVGYLITYSRTKAYSLLSLFVMASFLFNLAIVSEYPKAAYYLPFSRFWEMGIGCLLAYYHHCEPISFPQEKSFLKLRDRSVISMVGIFFILCGFLTISEKSRFPGWLALLPCIGTACIIEAGSNAPLNKNILGNEWLVFLGKLSYPLYLWHWPLLVYPKLYYSKDTSSVLLAQPSVLVLIAFGLSLLTYYLVEEKVRYRTSKAVLGTLIVLMISLTLAACLIMIFSSTSFTSTTLNSNLNSNENNMHNMHNSILPSNLNQSKLKGGDSLSFKFQENTTTATNKNKNQQITNNSKSIVILNSSRGPFLESITKQKITAAIKNFVYPPKGLEKLDVTSKFYIPSTSPAYILNNAYILNKGQTKSVVVLGDSHANQVAIRFVKIVEDAKTNNKTLPTIVFRSINAVPSLPCHPTYTENFKLIQRTKPTAVIIIINWILHVSQLNPEKSEIKCCLANGCANNEKKIADEVLRLFFLDIKSLVSLGIQVHIGTFYPIGDPFDPKQMMTPSGIIHPIQIVKKSEYRNNHTELIQQVETGIRNAGAQIFDLSENFCWNDVCQPIEQHGHPIFGDDNHFRPYFAKSFLQVLDFTLDSINNSS